MFIESNTPQIKQQGMVIDIPPLASQKDAQTKLIYISSDNFVVARDIITSYDPMEPCGYDAEPQSTTTPV